jgi:lipopolysaccharide cholinephosphotransferase
MDLTLAQQVLGIQTDYLQRINFDRFKARKLKYPGNREIFKENLLDIKKVLDKNNVSFFLMFGTLLGAIRDKKFIKTDIDTDLGFFREDKVNFYKVILELRDYDFWLIRTDHNDNLISVRRDDEYIDFCFFDRINIPITNLIEYPFIGETFLIPENYDEILTELYGDWHIVNNSKHDGPKTIYKLDL